MNENLRTTIAQKLDSMSDETGRQLLDYVEFLESKFNRSSRERSTFERLAENVEGTLRSSKIGEAAVKGTGGIIDVAGTVARSFAAAGQAVLDELQGVVDDDAEAEKAEQPPSKETDDQSGETPASEDAAAKSDSPEASEEKSPEEQEEHEKPSA